MGNKSSKSKGQFGDFDVDTARNMGLEAPPPYSRPSSPVEDSKDPTSSKSTKALPNLRLPMRQESVEDALETLRKYDTVIIMDDSGSMRGALWEEAKSALAGLAQIAAQYDADGIDIYFLNSPLAAQGTKDADQVERLFQQVRPYGYTPTGRVLETLLNNYIEKLENAKKQDDRARSRTLESIKPVNFLVITDGQPTDDPKSVIIAAARRLDVSHVPLSQVGIQFVQVGNEKSATKFLQSLDDELQATANVRDIVDTTPYDNAPLSDQLLIKVLLGGINRRVDNHGAEAVMSS